MQMQWAPSSHPVSDIRDWSNRKRLEVRPDFQRKAVWSDAAKVLLMDTILCNIPMPKVFLQTVIIAGDTHRIVIDGQQRLLAILEFLNDSYRLEPPYEGPYANMIFSELPQEIQDNFLAYKIDTNEIRNATPEAVATLYSRVNKYTFALTKQELRRADFPGDFLKLSEKLVTLPFFEDSRIFTIANSKRMGDVEFVSELLALLIDGPQDKRETLDSFYLKLMVWDTAAMTTVESDFINIIADIQTIWSGAEPNSKSPSDLRLFSKTRFRQKADFYALFSAIHMCRQLGGSLAGKHTSPLLADLTFLDEGIEPEARIPLLSKYAIQCLSQSNTIRSRRWRSVFLYKCIWGSFFSDIPLIETVALFHRLLADCYCADADTCSPQSSTCPVCGMDFNDYSAEHVFLTWRLGAPIHQMLNSVFVHHTCKEAGRQGFLVWDIPYQIDDNFLNM